MGLTLSEAQGLYRRGLYADLIKGIRLERENEPLDTRWLRLEMETLLTVGRYGEAFALAEKAVPRDPLNLRLRLQAWRAALFSGHPDEAKFHRAEMARLISMGRFYARDAEALIAVGEAALLLGAEPKVVLTNIFKPAQTQQPVVPEAYLAPGRLAVQKRDYQLASRTYQEGLKAFPDDPDLWAGLAACFLDGDRKQLVQNVERALSLNPQHAPSRLLLAEHLIDGEQYDLAQNELSRVLDVNPLDHRALALRAVLATLRNNEAEAERERKKALSTWATNPEVDHIIGRKLSQKYRFAEGSASQRRALAFDDTYTAARIQLAQDLLRLGRDEEGWPLVAEAHKSDAYDVTAFNLTTLRDKLASFTTLTSDHFRLKMSAEEAPIYGARALALLERARTKLATKYGLELNEPVTVEIYPSAGDFAVRTFGMPDNPGFLGVCFGVVITVNSPASQSANWEAVLWHEYCHVVTLSLTRNRMPRWLSEGISVYEEQLENPAWGRRMSLEYHDRISTGKIQPISAMSAAFLQAKTGSDLQFAYFQSSLVVTFLMERFGLEKMKAVLRALGEGSTMNDALSKHMGALETLDREFAAHAKNEAAKLGKSYTLAKPKNPLLAEVPMFGGKSFHQQLNRARELMGKKSWPEAKAQLIELTRDGPYLPGEENTMAMLAEVCRELGDVEGERAAWLTIAEREGDAGNAFARLLVLAQEAKDWPSVARWSESLLAINPLAPTPWRARLEADERQGDATGAATAGEVLLLLDPPDAAALHYRVAKQLEKTDVEKARRHVLAALEEAPRFRSAYELLSRLPRAQMPSHSPSAPSASPPSSAGSALP